MKMKKVLLIFAIALSFNAFSQETLITVGVDKNVRYEVVSDSLKQVLTAEAIELLKDSAFRAELSADVKEQLKAKPEEGSGFMDWVYFILGFVGILGAVISKIPTSKSLWYLRPLQELFEFIFVHLIAPENKDKKGGTHNFN